jgi:hypothetical protein
MSKQRDPAISDARRRGWPMSWDEVKRERLNKEDYILRADVPVEPIPKFEVRQPVPFAKRAFFRFTGEVRNLLHP